MLPSDFAKKWAIILGVVIFAVAGSFFFLSRQLSIIPKTSSSIQEQRPFPTDIVSQMNSNFKILYQDPNDTEGRTLLYSLKHPMVGINFPNHGIVFDQINQKRISYIVSIVRNWENIDNSKDMYITIYDPVSKTELLKARLVLDISPSFSNLVTGFGIENLGLIDKSQDGFSFLSSLMNYGYDKVRAVIQTGDAVVIRPRYISPDASRYETDENNIMIARSLSIRRLSGFSAVKRYLGSNP